MKINKYRFNKKLNRYNHSGDVQKWIKLVKIVVETEEDKEQLLLASKYIHNLRNIDTDIMGANMLAHLYTDPDLIVVGDK